MKAKVIYYTKSGHTQQIAEAIGEELGCQVTNMDVALDEFVDVLFFGASVYKFGIDKKVLEFIDTLDPNMIGNVVIFSTSALSDSGYSKLVKKFTSKNIKVSESHYYCKGEFMLLNKNHPNLDDSQAAKKFARSIIEK